jgi:hypothetical protein
MNGKTKELRFGLEALGYSEPRSRLIAIDL